MESPLFESERVIGITQAYNPEEDGWCWYATVYAQMRGSFKEKFELQRFPFIRTAVQIQIQSKLSTKQLLFVPYNIRTCLPSYSYNVAKDKVDRFFPRVNSFKFGKSPGVWNVENHHGFIIPEYMSPPMPSGNKFCTFVLCMQLKQEAGFYLWNTVPIVFALPILSTAALREDLTKVADRMAVTLTLLLTMASYKSTVSVWIPKKTYLTWMDWYLLAGFALLLVQGLWIGMGAFLTQWIDQEPLLFFEQVLWSSLMTLWILSHLWFLCKRNGFYSPWPEVLANENDDLLEVATQVAEEQNALKQVIFLNQQKPKPPANSAAPQQEDTKRKTLQTRASLHRAKSK